MQYAADHPLREPRTLQTPDAMTEGKLLVDGNEMCAAAAIFAGCEFFGGYPITPSSEIMQFFAREIWKYGGAMLQCEDEIAGIGAVVGASFAGKKAMTATSGPGMSLKTEMLGLASIAELPLVCVNVQRGGPSTGLPTKSEQADLFQACFSAHGDVVRPVLAPTSVADTFGLTVEAFNIAEQYQTPVILLSDQEIAQRKETVDPIDTAAVPRGRPQAADRGGAREVRALQADRLGHQPDQPPRHAGRQLPGLRHRAQRAGRPDRERRGARADERQAHPQARPAEAAARPVRDRGRLARAGGPGRVGQRRGRVREALELARKDGIQAKLLVPKLLFPVAEEVYGEFFRSVQAGLVVEQSHQGQLYRILRMYLDVPAGVVSLAQSGSNPILPAFVLERLQGLVLGLQRQRVAEVEPAG